MTVIYHHRPKRTSARRTQSLRKWLRTGRATCVAIVLALCPHTAWIVGGCLASKSRGSIGAVLGRDTASGAVHLREVPDGMAAAEAGLIPGDRLKMIDGVLVDELDAQRIKALLRGPVGSELTLTIVRGQEVMHVVVTRSELGQAPAMKRGEERIE